MMVMAPHAYADEATTATPTTETVATAETPAETPATTEATTAETPATTAKTPATTEATTTETPATTEATTAEQGSLETPTWTCRCRVHETSRERLIISLNLSLN